MIRLALLLLLVATPRAAFPDDDVVAYKAGKILTISGEEISPGTILVRSGKILEIGKEVVLPEGARVVDLSAYTLMPGLVHAGLRADNEETSEITPDFRVTRAVDPDSPLFQRLRKLGVTTVLVEPGNRNVIGGLGSVFKTDGADFVVREDVFLKAAMGNGPSAGNFAPRYSVPSFYSRRPTTRMGVVWEFRKAFIDARKARDEESGGLSEGTKILVRAMEKKLPVRVYASRAFDIETALRLAGEFGLDIQLEGAHEAYIHSGAIAKRKIPVVLRPEFQTGQIHLRNGGVNRLDTFARLCDAGIRVALLPGGTDPRASLLDMALFAVRCGGDRGKALRAITLTPAELIGVADRVGSLAPGKDADFLVLNGDPLDPKTGVKAVYIGGIRVAGKSLHE